MKYLTALLALSPMLFPASVRADYKDDIGYTALQLQLGVNIPTGDGVTVAQVEADADSSSAIAYLPDTADSSFSLDNISNATTSGAYTSSSISTHATMVGKLIYGSEAIASGISSVSVYNANDWLVNRLRYGVNAAPRTESKDIENHSWVGSTGSSTSDANILQRLDYSIQTDDFVAVVGVNNGTGAEQNLLSSAYNVIGVGVSSGNHSSDLTTIDGAGRLVVHLVVPVSTTSEATAVVSSASALLIQTARSNSMTNGEKSETVKAVLMAGATKSEFSSWSRTTTQPLDATYGAGELNVQNSYNILVAGEQNANASTEVAATGWDYGTVSSSTEQTYRFTLQDESSLSVALTWNALVSASSGWTDLTTSLANLDLQLYTADGLSLGSLLDESLSTVDNVEYIWLENLAAGSYILVVKSASSSSTDYAIAWQTIPEPQTFFLLGIGLALIACSIVRKRSLAARG